MRHTQLQRLRDKHRLRNDQIARMLGVSKSLIDKIMRGSKEYRNGPTCVKVLDLLVNFQEKGEATKRYA